MAEHMLILKLTSPAGRHQVHRRRVPERLRQDQPRDAQADHPGLEGRGDRRRHRLDAHRRGRPPVGRQPRVRLLRRRARHQRAHQPERDGDHQQGQLGLHQRRAHRRTATSGGRAWRTRRPRRPSWKGEPWTPESDELSSHANSRYCTPIKQCDMLAAEYDDPRGVPIDAILFGGRRKTTIPLVTEARDWTHGTFMGATLSSETTAAAVGAVGVVRRDPMAMLPFIGYNAGDYFSHWINMGKDNDAVQDAQDLLRQLVPPRRGRRLPVARLRREQPRPEVGHRAPRGHRPPRSRPRSATCRRRARSTSTAST